MISVTRRWSKKGRLEGARVCTSDGYTDITWAKNGEATVLYGKFGKKPRRIIGLPSEGMEFGDSVGRQRNVFNGFLVRRQSIIKKCQASFILDGKEMPSDQTVFDLNRSYKSRQEIATEKLITLRKLFDLSEEEAQKVVAFTGRLKSERSNG